MSSISCFSIESSKKRCFADCSSDSQYYKQHKIPTLETARYSSTLEIAFQLYKDNLYFHGTSKKSAKNIVKYGMRLDKKVDGATIILNSRFGLDDKQSCFNHYVMTKKQAACYAKMHKNPKLVRLILPTSLFNLKLDPEANVFGEEFKVNKNIDDWFVLPLKKSNLKTKQIQSLNSFLGIFGLSKSELKELKYKIRSEIIGSSKGDKDLILKSVDFVKEEAARSSSDIQAILKSGIDISTLKEGDTFSLEVD